MHYKRADDVQMVCRFKEPTLTPPKEGDLNACILFVFLSKDYLDLKDFILFLCLENFWILCLIKRWTLNDERWTKSVFVSTKNPLNPKILRRKYKEHQNAAVCAPDTIVISCRLHQYLIQITSVSHADNKTIDYDWFYFTLNSLFY